MKSKIVEYYLFTVVKGNLRQDVKIYGYEVSNKSEAAAHARKYGKIESSITIYQKD